MKLKLIWPITSECERACHLCVGFLWQGGMHEPVERQGEFLMAVHINHACVVLRPPIPTQHFRYLRIWFETASLHSALAQSFVRVRTCVCVYIYIRFMNDWILESPLEQSLKLQEKLFWSIYRSYTFVTFKIEYLLNALRT